MGATVFKWTMVEREVLSGLLKEGYAIEEIARITDNTRWNIKKEIKNGLTEEELQARRYIKYDPDRSVYNTALQFLGEDGLQTLIKCVRNKEIEKYEQID